MGAPKQKWTSEEEAALRAGVDRHGPGKWRAIQKDPDFGPCLVTRSNVDLKDKWRNMNVGSGGHGSREKSVKSVSRHALVKATDECIPPTPLAIGPGEFSTDDTNVADTLVSSENSKDRKSLGPRYTDLIIKAISELKEPNGSSASAIAASVEAYHRVPSNFRRLLSSKLRDMVNQGSLLKSRQNFKVNTAEPAAKSGVLLLEGGDKRKQTAEMSADVGKQMKGVVKSDELESPTGRSLQDVNDGKRILRSSRNHLKKKGDGIKKARLDVDFARAKLKTAEEAARAAALAVAEAEAAAAAAEKAAKEAEAAEAEVEAAEIAAEIAALAARPPKKVRAARFAIGVAVAV